MQYIPKEITEEVNVPKTSPIAELFILLAGILGIVIAIYILTGFAVDIVASVCPSQLEQRIGNLYKNSLKCKQSSAESQSEAKIQKILDKIAKKLPNSQSKHYTVYVLPGTTVNAGALPGNNIVIWNGLLRQITSENELTFILGHELGHFAHKDHLRSLGRGLVLLFISSSLFGEDSTVTNFIENSMSDINLKFSQQQESAADLYAIDLVEKEYGHVGGALDFLEEVSKTEKAGKIFYFFATHPHPLDRLETGKKWIKSHNYPIKETIPMKFDL